ncbi:MAG: HEPN domain-containing protein, partial [Xanthobacteraceae bacterium]
MSELWHKALEAADDARLLLREGRFNGASNRAYYAMFNTARALLIERYGAEAFDVKRHATVLRLFPRHFIDAGHFDASFGAIMRRAAEVRRVADYDEMPVSRNEAQQILDAMER